MDLDKVIRKVPDFPKKGVLFYDITSIFLNADAFGYIIDQMKNLYSDLEVDGVIAIESRGFLIGAPFARERRLPLLLARKKGKLPGDIIAQSYSLEYGKQTLEIHRSDLETGKKWLIVDDLIATGGTLEAVADMVESEGASVAGIFAMIGLPFLGYEEKLARYKTRTLINYSSEEI